MAILEQQRSEVSGGIRKTIEAGTEEILFDFLQSTQYMYPERSAIRELFSNCRDSITEKQQYFQILSGKAKPGDFYTQLDGELYKDSKYDPSYYNEKWLSKTEDTIQLIYEVNGNAQRDSMRIIDNGVGLGGIRLEKHFSPFYSTKRLSLQQVGKFGLGSKSGLALDIDYYTLISRYNGLEFHFNVYNYKFESIVPKINLAKGEENPVYTCQVLKDEEGNPYQFHAYHTDKPNGVEVVLQAKKGRKKEFFDAVKGQLLYVDGIQFIVLEDGQMREEPVKAEIEYEDDIFILPSSKSTYYSKPHIVLNGISYGYINWLQMEVEDRAGNIGIKISPSEVDVTMNRESVRWTERTRNAVYAAFKEGEKIASKILENALQSDDIFDWALKAYAATSAFDQGSIIGRFSNIVDLKKSELVFKPIPKLSFFQDPNNFLKGYEVWRVDPVSKTSKATGEQIKSLLRTKVHAWGDLINRPILVQDEKTLFRTEMWLMESNPNGFIKVIPKDGGSVELTSELLKELGVTISFDDWKALSEEEQEKEYRVIRAARKAEWGKLQQAILDSKLTTLYSSVTVPDEYRVNETEEEVAAEENKAVLDKLSAEEQRKLDNQILVKDGYYMNNRSVKARELLLDTAEVHYGFYEDDAKTSLVSEFVRRYTNGSTFTDEYKVLIIAKDKARWLQTHTYIDHFFMNYDPLTKTIGMHNMLVRWQTARKIHDQLEKMIFLVNFQLFDPEAVRLYNRLKEYHDKHWFEPQFYRTTNQQEKVELKEALTLFADQLTEFQLFVDKEPEEKAIVAKSKALFGTDEDGSFKNAMGINLPLYRQMEKLLEHIEPIATLLNQVGCLTSVKPISYEVEQEIRSYLNLKEYICIPAQQPVLQAVELEEVNEA